ncbi:MAG: hypothetical protein HDQ93_03600 [Desulfovibrio sp.]|nr:hypothetical protein [Desulfovibrio sp.]
MDANKFENFGSRMEDAIAELFDGGVCDEETLGDERPSKGADPRGLADNASHMDADCLAANAHARNATAFSRNSYMNSPDFAANSSDRGAVGMPENIDMNATVFPENPDRGASVLAANLCENEGRRELFAKIEAEIREKFARLEPKPFPKTRRLSRTTSRDAEPVSASETAINLYAATMEANRPLRQDEEDTLRDFWGALYPADEPAAELPASRRADMECPDFLSGDRLEPAKTDLEELPDGFYGMDDWDSYDDERKRDIADTLKDFYGPLY